MVRTRDLHLDYYTQFTIPKMDIERLRTSMTRFITKKMRVTARWTARLSAGDSPLKLVGSKCPNGLVAKAKLPKPIAIMATDHVIASRGS